MKTLTQLLLTTAFALAPALCAAQIPSSVPTSLPSTLTPSRDMNTRTSTAPQVVVTTSSTLDEARLKAAEHAPRTLVEPPINSSKLDALKKQARDAVFVVHATQAPNHVLATHGVSFDGACVALKQCPEAVDVPTTSEVMANEPEHNPNSFFGRGLDRATSPFAKREAPETTVNQTAQCYLTTADWLTNSQKIDIIVHKKPVTADIVLRDDAQNVVVLQTRPVAGVHGLELAPYDAPQTPFAYALINPDETFENFSEQSFVIDMPHRYGLTSLTARNGYPLINAHAQIVGLTVNQTSDHTRSTVVHYGLIDRALNPEKYDRTVTERSELVKY